jgi:branched-chain amino acid transport system substrate-binding protein
MDAVAGPMMRQLKQLGMNVKFMGGDGICSEELAKLAGDAMSDGQVICAEAGGVTKEKEKGMADFKAKFKAKFNTDVQIYAPYVYDSINVMVAAMQKADSVDSAKYLPALQKISYDGVTGKIAFDAKGDVKDGALTLYTYNGGKRAQMRVVK